MDMSDINTALEAFSQNLLEGVEDIDKNDFDNPQLCSEFVNDIYHYMRKLEVYSPAFCRITVYVWLNVFPIAYHIPKPSIVFHESLMNIKYLCNPILILWCIVWLSIYLYFALSITTVSHTCFIHLNLSPHSVNSKWGQTTWRYRKSQRECATSSSTGWSKSILDSIFYKRLSFSPFRFWTDT